MSFLYEYISPQPIACHFKYYKLLEHCQFVNLISSKNSVNTGALTGFLDSLDYNTAMLQCGPEFSFKRIC